MEVKEGRLMREFTFTEKGLGKGVEGLCQVCGAKVLGCPADDQCPATKFCPYHYFRLHA